MSENYGGAKLGVRIANVVSQAIVSTHSKLLHVKHRLAMAIFHSISDMISDEVHGTIGPILHQLHDEYDPDGLAYGLLHFVATQKGQLQAAIGTAASASGLLSSVGEIVNNELSPSVRGILRSNPHLLPDTNTVARLAAMNLSTGQNAVEAINEQGIDTGWAEALIAAQHTYPDVSTALDLLRRNVIESAHFREWMLLNGYRSEDIDALITLVSNPISPADAALALLRGNIDQAEAYRIASDAGLSQSDFNTLVANTGEPLGLMELLEARRRGFIDDARLERGIIQSRIRNEWLDVAKAIAFSPMSTADAVNAVVQNHLSQQQGASIASQNGLEPGMFDTLIQTAGEPLSRTEMEQLFNRGLVTEAEVKQALAESRLKNKYSDLAFALHERLLPIRNLSEAVEFGAMTMQQAVTEAMKQGYSESNATALIQSASARKLQTYRHGIVTAAESLYIDNAMSLEDAMTVASHAGFDTAEATAIFQGAEYKRQSRMVGAATSAVRAKYILRHLDKNAASTLLDSIGILAEHRDQLLAIWDIERSANVAMLTEAQIVKAYKKGTFTQQQATDRLSAKGYSVDDIAVLLEDA